MSVRAAQRGLVAAAIRPAGQLWARLLARQAQRLERAGRAGEAADGVAPGAGVAVEITILRAKSTVRVYCKAH